VVKRNGQHPFQHDGRVNHLFSRLPPYVRQPPLVIHLHFAYPAIRCRLPYLWFQAVKRNVRGFWGFRPFSFCASKSGRCTPDSFSLYHPDEIQVHHLCLKPPRSCEHGQQNHGTLKVIPTIARYGTHLLESVGSIQGALRPCLCRWRILHGATVDVAVGMQSLKHSRDGLRLHTPCCARKGDRGKNTIILAVNNRQGNQVHRQQSARTMDTCARRPLILPHDMFKKSVAFTHGRYSTCASSPVIFDTSSCWDGVSLPASFILTATAFLSTTWLCWGFMLVILGWGWVLACLRWIWIEYGG